MITGSRIEKKRLQEIYGDEQVFVVPFSDTLHICDKFKPSNVSINELRAWDLKGSFMKRYDAEENVGVQQLIPYILIKDYEGIKFYVSKRIAGDERLKGKYSLGFGGHINPEDGSRDLIITAMKRELEEEVNLQKVKDSTEFIGYVRDLNSNTKEHLGFVFTVKVRNVKIKEQDKLEGLWMTLDDLINHYFDFESWARHIIDFLFIESKKKTIK